MAKLKRLPNGYRKQVLTQKQQLKKVIQSIEGLKDWKGNPKSLDDKLSMFAMHVKILFKTQHYNKDGIKSSLDVMFKTPLLIASVRIDNQEHWKLSDTCKVYILDTYDCVESYKW